jgi:hypothetical protein
MLSAAQRLRNSKAAQKSTGPTSEAGKKRSSQNAVKHGLTAKTVMLPGESVAEFQQKLTGLFDGLKPRDPFEVALVERAGYLQWQIDRCGRAESARLWERAYSRARDERNRVEQEVTGLLQTLLRAPEGRPTALPFAVQPAAAQEAGENTWAATFDYADHPARVLSHLEASGHGCACLIELWSELAEPIQQGFGWEAPERFRAYRLMGLHAIDAYMTKDLATILHACQVLDPGAESIVWEVWNEGMPADQFPRLETRYKRDVGQIPVLDYEAAKQYLLEVVRVEIERLEEKVQEFNEQAEVAAALADHRAAFDLSKEGELVRRYQLACEKLYMRQLDELYKHRRETAQRDEVAFTGRYFRPTAVRFEGVEERSHQSQGSNLDGQNGMEGAGGDGEDDEVGLSADGQNVTIANDGRPRGVAVKPILEEKRPQAGVDRPRLEKGYENKIMTGSKREKRRLRRLERVAAEAAAGRKNRG